MSQDGASRVALATCRGHPGLIAGDDEALTSRLERAEFRVERVCWDDPDADWAAFDAVLIRTTWDYQERLDEFLGWVDRVSAETNLFNAPEIVRANVDKRYLATLADAGVPIVPTAWISEPTDAPGIDAILDARDWAWAVCKPVVGAGASGLLIFARHEAARAARHVNAQLEQHPGVMLQPLVESVKTEGELSVVLFDGAYSHAVRKLPAPDEWRVQIEFGGRYTPEQPSRRALDVSVDAVRALAPAQNALYARIDLVDVDGIGPAVIEAELVEPELFFPWFEQAGDVLAAKLRSRLQE